MPANPYSFNAKPELNEDSPLLLYLAAPYSHPKASTRKQRFASATIMAAHLMSMGYAVFSPLSHGHAIGTITKRVSLNGDFETWKRVDLAALEQCDAMVVFLRQGIFESKGVLAEVFHAEKLGIPLNTVELKENGALSVSKVPHQSFARRFATSGE